MRKREMILVAVLLTAVFGAGMDIGSSLSTKSLQGEVSTLQSQNLALQGQIQALLSNGTMTSPQVAALEAQIANLTAISNLNKTSAMVSSQVFTEAAGNQSMPIGASVGSFSSFQYAGYVEVDVAASNMTSGEIYVQFTDGATSFSMIMGLGGGTQPNTTTLQVPGSFDVPVLPGAHITIYIVNPGAAASETLSLTYHY